MKRLMSKILVIVWCVQGRILQRKQRHQQSPKYKRARSKYHQSFFWRLAIPVTQKLNRVFGWDKLPLPLGAAVLAGLRELTRRENLYDTYGPLEQPTAPEPLRMSSLKVRTIDGSYNDLCQPAMGMVGTRLGRNIPLEYTFPEPEPEILTPNPRTVSLELMTRERFQPATTINILAAAWLQFTVRDWFSHGTSPKENPWQIPLQADDTWPERPMKIMRVPTDPTQADNHSQPPTYINDATHWWDGSQVYGSTKELHALRRSGKAGKLIIGDDGLLPLPSDPNLNPALIPGWWLGMEMMQTLFTLEHNAICDRLCAEYPNWSDDEIFGRARLINAALMAKIHTVEWTPAIVGHPTSQFVLRANWWGIGLESFQHVFRLFGKNEILTGIPGSETTHFGVPYSITEEFTIVYRMHPLAPDDYDFRAAEEDHSLLKCTLDQLTGPQTRKILQQVSMTDAFYSFGTAYPGAIVLNNYPRHLQHFVRPDGYLMDLAATDILRTRELGVPRYNQFRKLVHLPAAGTFEEITDDPILVEKMRRLYNNDVEQVDLMVGMFAEKRPQGFAFGLTTFHIFAVMASRRLNSDRFFTKDFTPEVYTPSGMDWIKKTTMSSLLLRHYPQLYSALQGVENAFMPWPGSR